MRHKRGLTRGASCRAAHTNAADPCVAGFFGRPVFLVISYKRMLPTSLAGQKHCPDVSRRHSRHDHQGQQSRGARCLPQNEGACPVTLAADELPGSGGRRIFAPGWPPEVDSLTH
eukprot:356807-Chlamydomonas_euryale.AAC.3